MGKIPTAESEVGIVRRYSWSNVDTSYHWLSMETSYWENTKQRHVNHDKRWEKVMTYAEFKATYPFPTRRNDVRFLHKCKKAHYW